MDEELRRLYQLLNEDDRYPLEAYEFIRDALTYAQERMLTNEEQPPAKPATKADPLPPSLTLKTILDVQWLGAERHLTGQQLCFAIREYGLEQYGYLAKTVLNSWGLHTTSDFGNIVYNLISIDWMKKSPGDRQEHFDDVYDFTTAFVDNFRFPDVPARSAKAGS